MCQSRPCPCSFQDEPLISISAQYALEAARYVVVVAQDGSETIRLSAPAGPIRFG